ncbi:MAG TPA: DNA repair protein RecO [Anaerohalosphaeraceae bacterium]|nr:DNA repair protein RecO [Anaerohalosphaeraceae bacterium]HOL88789.1 DNA repair protein RecO [Anaerohalosphaeraceae bacterium]HPP55974.1 DNA repair protein RecO [Anaerohalosphaeraceae bacterium]
MQKKDQAICLRTVAYSDTSQIAVFFTETEGKISAIAKGSRRPKNPFDGPIEVFSYGTIVYAPGRQEGLAVLAEFAQQPLFLGLRRRLETLNAALPAAELTEKLTQPQDPHPRLFEGLRQFLLDVQEAADARQIRIRLIVYQMLLLAEIGLAPVMDRCVNGPHPFGRHWKWIYFSSHQNGLLCPDCEGAFAEKKRISPAAAAALADLKRLKNADEKTIQEIENLLLYHFRELTGRPLKSKPD